MTSGVAHEIGAIHDLFRSQQDKELWEVDEISDIEKENTRDTKFLTDAEIFSLLRDEEPDVSSFPVLALARGDTETPGTASAVKPAAPTASSEDDTPVAPETQSIQLEPVTEIPKPTGSVDASQTTPESEKGGEGDEQEAEDPNAWKKKIDLSHICPSSV